MHSSNNYLSIKEVTNNICNSLDIDTGSIKLISLNPTTYSINNRGKSFCYISAEKGEIYLQIIPNQKKKIDCYFQFNNWTNEFIPTGEIIKEKEYFYNSFLGQRGKL